MTKEQQIEEMATFIHGRRDKNGSEKTAKALFDAGYRKVPKYAVILSAKERDEEMKAYNEERKELDNELLTMQMSCLSAYFEVEQLQKENKQLQEQLNSANAGNVNCSGCGLVGINAVKEFAEKLKTELEEKEQHYICMYDWDGHSAVVDCANEVDELLKEYER